MFYIFLSAVVPCDTFDNCENEHKTDQVADSTPENDSKDCSPFSICASCNGFTISHEYVSIAPLIFYNKSSYNSYHISPKSEYYFSFFQPPRIL